MLFCHETYTVTSGNVFNIHALLLMEYAKEYHKNRLCVKCLSCFSTLASRKQRNDKQLSLIFTESSIEDTLSCI